MKKIIEELERNEIEYEKHKHAPVITSSEAAKIRKTKLNMGAKALLFIADGIPIILVVPGDRKADTKKFKEVFSIKDLRMATGEELKECTGLEKGALPPIGSVFSIQSYFDNELKKNDKVAFNAGSRSISIVMSSKDLIEMEKPILGSFSKPAGT
ncbi:hypothetical protein JXA34_00520 [Patescibacteria group bacterium]|nr:hypothetical protein [Patescibacteria group bacterium]